MDHNAPESNAETAWRLYKSKGVILPGYADVIAERRKIVRNWAKVGRGLH